MQDYLLALIPVVLMIALLLVRVEDIQTVLPCCVIDSHQSNPSAQEQAAPAQQAAPVPSAPDTAETEEERRHARRLKILTTLVHKVSQTH